MTDPAIAGGLAGVAITNVTAIAVAWIKSRKRKKDDSVRSKDIHAIKTSVEEVQKSIATTQRSVNKVDRNLGIINTHMENMQKTCCATTARFDKEIRNNRQQILELAKDSKK